MSIYFLRVNNLILPVFENDEKGNEEEVRGALSKEKAIDVLKREFNCTKSQIESAFRKRERKCDEAQMVILPGEKKVVVKLAKHSEKVYGSPVSLMELFKGFQEEFTGQKENLDSESLQFINSLEIRSKKQQITAPFLITNKDFFCSIWPGAMNPPMKWKDYAQEELLVWMTQYRDYGMTLFVRDYFCEFDPINGERSANNLDLTQKQQFVLQLVALDLCTQLQTINQDGRSCQLVYMLEVKRYVEALCYKYNNLDMLVTKLVGAFTFLKNYLEQKYFSSIDYTKNNQQIIVISRLSWLYNLAKDWEGRSKLIEDVLMKSAKEIAFQEEFESLFVIKEKSAENAIKE